MVKFNTTFFRSYVLSVFKIVALG